MTRSAVAGKAWSGVLVARMTASTSEGSALAWASASRAAAVPMKAAVSNGAAKWRWRMPVRSRIHSSVVSTVRDRSSLVTIRSGKEPPTPAIMERIGIGFPDRGRLIPRESRGRESAVVLVFVPSAALVQSDPGQILADAIVEVVHHHVHRDVDGMREAARVGAAVRLHHDAVQPDHDGAV